MDLPRHLVESTFCQVVPNSKTQRRANGKLLINARCPICGDSNNKRKRRFYLYEKNGKYNVSCKNCMYGKSFKNFLKEYHLPVYENLLKMCMNLIKDGDFFKKAPTPAIFNKITPDERIHKFFLFYFSKCCIKLDCPQENAKLEKARKYCISVMKKRNLSEDIWKNYYFCHKGKFNWRIIIPFIDNTGKYYNFQARDVHPQPDEDRKAKKYIFAKFNKIELPDDKMYKQYLVDPTKTVYVCEGILDSEFVGNAIATCGVGIGGDRYDYIKSNFQNRIFCLDSPWTDFAAWEMTGKLLAMDEICFMMPSEHKDCKDMNDLAKKLNVEKIPEEYIKANLLTGKVGLCKLKMLTRGLHAEKLNK
jgi:hypothetical protein